jgi:hypothetical protein
LPKGPPPDISGSGPANLQHVPNEISSNTKSIKNKLTSEKHKTNLTNVNPPQAMQFAVSSFILVSNNKKLPHASRDTLSGFQLQCIFRLPAVSLFTRRLGGRERLG